MDFQNKFIKFSVTAKCTKTLKFKEKCTWERDRERRKGLLLLLWLIRFTATIAMLLVATGSTLGSMAATMGSTLLLLTGLLLLTFTCSTFTTACAS